MTMKKLLSLMIISIMVVMNVLPVFAAKDPVPIPYEQQVAVYRKSKNESNEMEQYAKASEEWLKSKEGWITGGDIYFKRYGGRDFEHAAAVDVEKKTITTARGNVYDLNYDGFLREFSGTQFFKKTGNSDKPWEAIKWPQIVIKKEKEEGSDSDGKYFYYKYKYEFVDGY